MADTNDDSNDGDDTSLMNRLKGFFTEPLGMGLAAGLILALVAVWYF